MNFSDDFEHYEQRIRKFIWEWEKVCEPTFAKSKFIDFKYFEKFKSDFIKCNVESKVAMTHSDTLRDRFLCSIFNRFKFMGKVRKYTKFHNFISHGNLKVIKRVVDVSRKSVCDLIRNNRGSFSFDNDLPLPIGSVSKIVGVFRGKYPIKYFKGLYKPDFTALHFLRSASEEFRDFVDNNSIRVLSGDWQFSWPNLRDMCTPHKRKYNYDDMFLGLRSRVNIDLVLPKIPFYDVKCINSVRVNHTSFNGLNTSSAFGGKRSLSTRFTKPAAYHYCKDVIMKPRGEYILDTSLYHVGGREKKVVSPYETSYKEVRTRVTLCQEDVPTIIGQSVCMHIMESLQKLSEGFNWGGRINGRGNFLNFINNLKIEEINLTKTRYDKLTNFMTDFSGHDNNVSREQIIFGMGLLRCCYPESKEIDRVFFYILSSLVRKRVVLPDSKFVYEITKGIPSGHSFTAILTTVCAYVTIATAIAKVVPKDEICDTHLQGAGDDWNGRLHSKYLKPVSDHINIFSGSKCDVLYVNNNSIILNADANKPTFLKKNYKFGLIAWNKVELFTNYSYPTSLRSTIGQYYENATVMCVSGPFDIRLNTIFKNLIIIKVFEKFYYRAISLGFDVRKEMKYNLNHYIEKVSSLAGFLKIKPIDLSNEIFNNVTIHNQLGVLLQTVYVRDVLTNMMEDFDRRIRKSMVWMLSNRVFEKYEKIVRLKVFDTKKKYYSNIRYNHANNIFLSIYNDKRVSVV